jgi:hypothetical protein
MPNRTEAARGRRSEARERRRSRGSQPLEELDQAAGSTDSEPASRSNGELAGAAAKLAGTALAAGLLGALGGAAKALLDRRGTEGETEEAPEADEDQPQDMEEPQHEPEAEREEPQPEAAATKREQSSPELHGVSENEAGQVVAKARSQLESLLGTGVERVSGLERANGRWSVTAEVVEVARVPESTDVMATYEVVLDDGCDLVSVNRVRRYRRSQVDDQA